MIMAFMVLVIMVFMMLVIMLFMVLVLPGRGSSTGHKANQE